MSEHDRPADATIPPEDRAERDLDRMLDLLAPPPPSETLRARLARMIAVGRTERPVAALGAADLKKGGSAAVAAALTLAVMVAVALPPGGAPRVAPTDGRAALDAADADRSFAAEAFAESAPDSVEFMVAALTLAQRPPENADGPAQESAEPSFEGIPLE